MAFGFSKKLRKSIRDRILNIKRLKMITDDKKKNKQMLILIFFGIIAFVIFRFRK